MTSEELFQTYAASGAELSLMPRSQVHRQGVWHKAVQVFVYRASGELLLQKRAANKDLHPSCWDTSVGEHLQPGEDFLAGAQRGLMEELGLVANLEPLGSEQRLKLAGEGYQDWEIQCAFHCKIDLPATERISFNDEVDAVKWVNKHLLMEMLENEDYRFTPWFHHHLRTYALLNSLS